MDDENDVKPVVDAGLPETVTPAEQVAPVEPGKCPTCGRDR